MNYPIFYRTLAGLCFLLAACHSEEEALPVTAIPSLHTAIDSYSGSSRATDASGYEGIIKKTFVSQDQITVYTDKGSDQEKTYTATLQADGSTWKWDAGNPLLLAPGTEANRITATYTVDNQPDDLITSSCSLNNGNITLHFMHRKALLSIQIWGNTQMPLMDLKLYDESGTAYPVTDGIALIPPGVRLCRVSFTWNGKEQTIKSNPIGPFNSGNSYKLNMYVGLITEEDKITMDLVIQDITSWTDDGAYLNGKWYPRDHIIATEDDLDALREKINNDSKIRFKGEEIILVSDLNFGGREPWTSGINEFSGTFLGNGHTIHNFFINTTANQPSAYSSEGFISYLSEGGTIDNLHFKDSGVNAQSIDAKYKHYIGILTGTNRGTITRCGIVNGNLRGSRNNTYYTPGSLTGMNYGKIIACHAKADIEIVINGVGGLIGNNNKGTLFGCYYDGKIYNWISGDNNYEAGLLIGYSFYNYSDSKVNTIRSCYGIKLANGSFEGRLLGKPHNYNTNPYYDKLEELEKNCLLLSNTAEASKADLIKDAEDVTDGNGIVWKAENIWNDDLTIDFDYHGEPETN